MYPISYSCQIRLDRTLVFTIVLNNLHTLFKIILHVYLREGRKESYKLNKTLRKRQRVKYIFFFRE